MTAPNQTTTTTAAWAFTDDNGTFELPAPQRSSYLYFPLANSAGMMSAVTPELRGDAKTGQASFLLTPVSVEDLHQASYGRNVWLHVDGGACWSTVGAAARQRVDAADDVRLQAGVLWHRIIRRSEALGIQAETTSFVPADGPTVELMEVRLTNTGERPRTVVPTVAIPIFARSADNLRDHRHVTGLLHRIATTTWGVTVRPTLVFDERGHRHNPTAYGVFGSGPLGEPPIGFFPLVHDFVGEGGSLDWPHAVTANRAPDVGAGAALAGYEALGGLRFERMTLQPGEQAALRVVLGIADTGDLAPGERYLDARCFAAALAETRDHWRQTLDRLVFITPDAETARWLRWVTVQPTLRRIYGCSFLPYHDYGRGGRGWRDLWQDCLALLLSEPDKVGELLLGNFAGVRIDGSNATIIGTTPGTFEADRNRIPRVWMDHAAWPWLTTRLYLDQTGDLGFLLRMQTYFRDAHIQRCRARDEAFSAEDDTYLRTRDGAVHSGTILEHLIIQHVTAFLNVGEHNTIRLEDADWNDGMDLAAERGESVALSSLYGSNLIEIGRIIEELEARLGLRDIALTEEVAILVDTATIDYARVSAKRDVLERFMARCAGGLSGQVVQLPAGALAAELQRMGRSLLEHIRTAEWVTGRDGSGWFNGYYDNAGRRVEGEDDRGVRMTLTGQVFAVLGGAATDDQVDQILASAERHLWDERVGGYRLNTDFDDPALTLGRCFGFAFGHKENGAMFCHMAVMFAYALYARGRARAGYRILETICRHSRDFAVSRIYPGIPEYFDARGRGAYPYLTGSASWYLYTLLTAAYGLRGHLGDLAIQPQLVAEQFDAGSRAAVQTQFAGRRLKVIYHNPERCPAGAYRVQRVTLNDRVVPFDDRSGGALIRRDVFGTLDADTVHELRVELATR